MMAEQVWGSTMLEEYTYIPLSEPESVRGRTGIKCGGIDWTYFYMFKHVQLSLISVI